MLTDEKKNDVFPALVIFQFWMREYYYNKFIYSALQHKVENYSAMNETIAGIQLLLVAYKWTNTLV